MARGERYRALDGARADRARTARSAGARSCRGAQANGAERRRVIARDESVVPVERGAASTSRGMAGSVSGSGARSAVIGAAAPRRTAFGKASWYYSAAVGNATLGAGA